MRSFALFCAALLTGCGSGEDLASSRSPILRGGPDADDRSVVAVVNSQTGVICSGVVVAPRAVLTARHCIAELTHAQTVDCAESGFGAVSDARRVVIATTRAGSAPDQRHAVVKIITPPEDRFCGGDLAVLVLAQPLATDEAPAVGLRGSSPISGETFTAVGFGRDGDQPSGVRKRREGLKVSCVGQNCRSALLTQNEWWGDGAVCEGDSGGPALDADGRVVGIASRKRDGCTATIYADVASSWSFLSRAVDEASNTPESADTAACSTGRSTAASPWIGIALIAFALYARGSSKPTRAPPPSRLRA